MVVNALSPVRGGADDNDAQGGTLIPVPDPAYSLAAAEGSRHGSGRAAQDTYVIQDVRGHTTDSKQNGPRWSKEDVSYTLGAVERHAVAFKPSHYTRDKDGAPSEVAPPLSADADKGDQDPVVAYRKSRRAQSAEDDETWVEDDKANTLNPFDQATGRDSHMIAAPLTGGSSPNSAIPGRHMEDDVNLVAQPIRTNPYNNSDPTTEATMHVQQGMVVRRLTPRECERLMAFPDDWTAINAQGKTISDSARYRMLGNAVVTSVAYWIGRRMRAIHEGRDSNFALIDLRDYIQRLNDKSS